MCLSFLVLCQSDLSPEYWVLGWRLEAQAQQQGTAFLEVAA